MITLDITNTEIVTFLLVFFRTGAIMLIAPVFGSRNIPMKVRVLIPLLISVVLTISLYKIIEKGNIPLLLSHGTVGIAVAIFGEIILGFAIGFTARLTFVALQVSGRLVGQEIGFGMVRILDPSTRDNVEIVGQYNIVIATLIFLLIHGHHYVLMGLAKSFSTIPPADQWLSGPFVGQMNVVFANVFSTGFRIALPVMGTLFLAKIAMGILARTMPQMNVFIVGFPLQVAVGLITMAVSLPFFVKVLYGMFISLQEDIWLLISNR